MAVGKAKVELARVTDDLDQLLLLALGLVTPVGEHFLFGRRLAGLKEHPVDMSS